MIPLYRYVVEGLRTPHQKKEGESSGGTSSPAPFWEGPAAPNAGMRHTLQDGLHCEEAQGHILLGCDRCQWTYEGLAILAKCETLRQVISASRCTGRKYFLLSTYLRFTDWGPAN